MSRNTFMDPLGDRSNYDWPINHDEEDGFGKDRNISHSSKTGDLGLVKQQGDSSPMVLSLKGTMLTLDQVRETIAWYQLCESQTIYFTDFAGMFYEVMITKFNPTRIRAAANPRGGDEMPTWYYKYELEMEVLRFGDNPADIWAGVTV